MELIGFDDDTHLDLHTSQGSYEYVGRFLNKYAAPSDVWACLGMLYRDPTRIEVDIKRLEEAIGRLLSRNSFPPDSKSGVIVSVSDWIAYLQGKE